MSVKKNIVFFYLFLSSVSLTMASSQDQGTSPASKKNQPVEKSQQYADDGERIFRQNCSRCHNTPESFQPSVSGTVVRHMRVRASLSKEDEKQLLRFLNP